MAAEIIAIGTLILLYWILIQVILKIPMMLVETRPMKVQVPIMANFRVVGVLGKDEAVEEAAVVEDVMVMVVEVAEVAEV